MGGRSWGVASALVLAACDVTALGEMESAVQNGELSAGQVPATGALRYTGMFEGTYYDQVSCSGTLIAPSVVLTAAHCVEPHIRGMGGVQSFTADNDAAIGTARWSTISSVRVHEGYTDRAVFHIYLETPNDVAVAFLADPITDVEPISIATTGQSASIVAGLEVSMVGYGDRVVGDLSTRGREYIAPMSLTQIGLTETRALGRGAPMPCAGQGDSGGPLVAMLDGVARIVGIMSHSGGMTLACADGNIHERVDVYASWIVAAAPEVCDHSPDAEGCPPVEPPPDPVVDDDDGGCRTTRGSIAFVAFPLLMILRRRATRR